MNRRLTLAAAAVAITLSTLSPAQAGNPPTVTPVGSPINLSNSPFNPALQEASGLGLAKNETKLWAISDEEFSIYKMNMDGSYATQLAPTRASGATPVSNPDFEGVTFGPPPPGSSNDHYVYVANEAQNAILPVNYDSLKYHEQAELSSMNGYNTVKCDGVTTVATEFSGPDAHQSGLEGIAWDPDLNSFFVIKEKNPGLMIRISADLGTILACKVLTFSGRDYSDVAYDSTRQRFWIVSDEAQSVYLYDWTSNTAAPGYPLGYLHGEGVAYDPNTRRLYIATDNGNGSDSYLYTYSVQ
jgi:uncharacterized protein YjiK